jgi:hypothetical protein
LRISISETFFPVAPELGVAELVVAEALFAAPFVGEECSLGVEAQATNKNEAKTTITFFMIFLLWFKN